MAGITSLLNIAKTALLTHQLNLQTTGHNVANVNTEGYSRQSVTLKPQFPNPTAIGPVGNGVTATDVVRAYDRFINSTLVAKQSDLSGLKTRQSGMKTIESLLNEVDETGLYHQLNEFWNAWDDVANNAEGIPERMTLIERAKLLVNGIRDRYNNLLKLSENVNMNLEQTVKDVNQTVDQIAELNVEIVAMEANGHQANDLRDQRDNLLKKLSGLVDLHYFETKRGTYTIIMGKGFQLVDGDKAWHIEYSNGAVNWIGTDGSRTELTTDEVGAGELGGWIDIKSRIVPRDVGLLIGSEPNTSGGRSINGWTRWDEIDGVTISGPFDIHFSGTDQDGLPVTGTFHYDPGPPEAGARVQDLLAAIEAAFSGAGKGVEAYINEDGRLAIKDLTPGDKPISFQIDSISGFISGLDLGKFDGRYPPNYLETLNQWATALIREVNRVHSQGVGLMPLTETTGVYSATNTGEPIGYRSSGLFFSNEVTQGEFEIWLYDSEGNVIDQDPATPMVNDPQVITIDPATTTMEDLAAQIDAISGLSARLVNGHLVIGIDGTGSVAGFAFGKDTSGALLATGLNAFFTGKDAETIGLSEAIKEDPRQVAAARVEPRGATVLVQPKEVADINRPLGIDVRSGSFRIYQFNSSGAVVGTKEIAVDPAHDTIQNIMDRINAIGGLFTELTPGGTIKIYSDSDDFAYIGLGGDTSSFLKYLGIPYMAGDVESLRGVKDVTAPLGSALSGLDLYGSLRPGTFRIKILSDEGALVDQAEVTFDPTTMSLEDLRDAINGTGIATASITGGRLTISTNPPGNGILALAEDNTGLLEALGLPTISQTITGDYAVEGLDIAIDDHELGVTSGTFNVFLYDENGGVLPGMPITIGIDAQRDGLKDVASMLDAIPGISARVVNGRLDIRAEDGANSFILTDDSTGLLDALGLKTPLGGGLFPADNENALSMRELARYSIDSLDGATLNEAYQNLIGQIGIETRGFKADYEFMKSAVSELEVRRDEVSGVSIDEELSDLLKFQHAYTAAAKLIKTADDVYISLLAAKQ